MQERGVRNVEMTPLSEEEKLGFQMCVVVWQPLQVFFIVDKTSRKGWRAYQKHRKGASK